MKKWTEEKILKWIDSQTGENYWYQTIPLTDHITIKGTTDSPARLKLMKLDDDLSGKSVLDIGCNSGMLCFECKKRNAGRVVGIDMLENRLEQARTIADFMNIEIEFKNRDLFQAEQLGEFDIVFCIAVLTEVTDLIRGLEILRKITKETLFLEIATVETMPGIQILDFDITPLLELNLMQILKPFTKRFSNVELKGTAKLRKIESRRMKGWALVPDREFLNSMLGDVFTIYDLGPSVRYNLFKMKRNPV